MCPFEGTEHRGHTIKERLKPDLEDHQVGLKITVERLDDHYDIMAISKETLYVCKTERCSANEEMLMCLNVTSNIAAKKKTKKHAKNLNFNII